MSYELADDSRPPPPPPPPPAADHAVPDSSGIQAEAVGHAQGSQSGPVVRDRIIVLGRRASGKTVYLARLYERLWNSRGEIHMGATDGQTHIGLMAQIDAMSKKQWPASTEQISFFKIDITYRREKYLMVALDYPGEVFRRAFIDGADEPAVRDLLENIDRAAAVIVLVDPGVMFERDVLVQADQDFGLVAAVKRIREWPGAEDVPVAITLTKCDRYREEIEAEGGPSRFIKDRYANLHRAVFGPGCQGMMFACSAVRSRRDAMNREVPDLSVAPKGLVEPLEYCLRSLQQHREIAERREQEEMYVRARHEFAAAQADADRKMARMTSWILGGAVLVILVAFVVFWKAFGA